MQDEEDNTEEGGAQEHEEQMPSPDVYPEKGAGGGPEAEPESEGRGEGTRRVEAANPPRGNPPPPPKES